MKSAYFIYCAVEAWNHANIWVFWDAGEGDFVDKYFFFRTNIKTLKFRVQHDTIHYMQPLLLYTENTAQNFLHNCLSSKVRGVIFQKTTVFMFMAVITPDI